MRATFLKQMAILVIVMLLSTTPASAQEHIAGGFYEDGLDLLEGCSYVLDGNIEVKDHFIVENDVDLNCLGHQIIIYAVENYLNLPSYGGDSDFPPDIYNFTYLIFDGLTFFEEDGAQRVFALWVNFEGNVSLQGCSDVLVHCCNFENNSLYCLKIDQSDLPEASECRIYGCNFYPEIIGMWVENFERDDQTLLIHKNQFHLPTVSTGIQFGDLEGQADLGHEELSPIQFVSNYIVGNLVDEQTFTTGIILFPIIEQRSLLVRNNVIRNCDQGIVFDDDSFTDNCFALIYNNALFDILQYGIYYYLRDINNRYSGVRIRNNVIWDGVPYNGEQMLCGIMLDNLDAGNGCLGDIDIANNIIGETRCGIGFQHMIDFDEYKIEYNAFKSNGYDIAWWDEDYEELDEAMGGGCVVHDRVIEDNEQYIALLNETPNDDDWDFHILVDNIEPGEEPDDPSDLNMDLVDSDDTYNDTWMDPPWYEGEGRHLRHTRHSKPDMGIYGGPYSKSNIYYYEYEGVGYLGNDYYDQIWVTDSDFGQVWDIPWEYYFCDNGLFAVQWPGAGRIFHAEAGTAIYCGDNVLDVAGTFQIDGGADTMGICFIFDEGGYINFTGSTDVSNSYVNYLDIGSADYGAYLSGVGLSGSAKLPFNNCVFDSCLTGIYANNSRVSISGCKITNSPSTSGKGVHLVNCSAGMVVMDHDTITHNGTVADIYNCGVYLQSSSPELTDCLIEDNYGAGITCFSSNPDLNTYYSGVSHANDIHSNGEGGSQSGSNGAEIYLASASYPSTHYNNIWDQNGQNQTQGVLIYKSSTCPSALSATNNYWGVGTPQNSWFYWDPYQSAITYSPYSGNYLNSADDFDLAMGYWDAGDYETAAEYFQRCVSDTGAIGVQAVHYLTGCVGEMENGDFASLREFLTTAADEQENAEVARIASRFATHCLTMDGDYEAALDEYDAVRQNADNLNDSVMAVVDILAVEELAGMDGLNAAGGSIQERMAAAMTLLDDGDRAIEKPLPETFSIVEAYPNPFNDKVAIYYQLSETQPVTIGIYDLNGRMVTGLVNDVLPAGGRRTIWDASRWTSGVYICRLEAGGKTASIKLALVR